MTGRQALRLHAWAFAAGAVVLSAANWYTGAPWWSFWPLAAWALVLAAHYLVRKSRSVDEHWADEHSAEVHAKSYDVDHIDRIAADQEGSAADGKRK
jgi:hypothetical protein